MYKASEMAKERCKNQYNLARASYSARAFTTIHLHRNVSFLPRKESLRLVGKYQLIGSSENFHVKTAFRSR